MARAGSSWVDFSRGICEALGLNPNAVGTITIKLAPGSLTVDVLMHPTALELEEVLSTIKRYRLVVEEVEVIDG